MRSVIDYLKREVEILTYYAKYEFKQCPLYPKSYLLVKKEGKTPVNLSFAKYTDSTKNIEAGIAGKDYIHFGVPRNPRMTRYFSHTFEGFRGKPITSTEALNDMNRTFGDTFNLGYKDLILFQFSPDMNALSMWFVKDKGNTREEKQKAFRNWCQGEALIQDW